jgi:hypothetical protein
MKNTNLTDEELIAQWLATHAPTKLPPDKAHGLERWHVPALHRQRGEAKSTKKGRPPEDDVLRTEDGRKSRSRFAVEIVGRIIKPTAYVRLRDLAALRPNATNDERTIWATGRLAESAIGRLFLLNKVNARQVMGGTLLHADWRGLCRAISPLGYASQSSRFSSEEKPKSQQSTGVKPEEQTETERFVFNSLDCFDTGHQVGTSRLDFNYDDQEAQDPRPDARAHKAILVVDEEAEEQPVTDDEMGAAIRHSLDWSTYETNGEQQLRGRLMASEARCGSDTWRLVEATALGVGLAPRDGSLPLLINGLDAVDTVHNPSIRSNIKMSRDELTRIN